MVSQKPVWPGLLIYSLLVGVLFGGLTYALARWKGLSDAGAIYSALVMTVVSVAASVRGFWPLVRAAGKRDSQ